MAIQRIYTRSPYYINAYDSGGITTATLELYVYKGEFRGDIPATPQYTLTKNVGGDTSTFFEISQLVRDFVSHQKDDGEEVNWVACDLTIDSVAQTRIELVAMDGYNEFEDGANFDNRKAILTDAPSLITKDDYSIYIPVSLDSDGIEKVLFLSNGNVESEITYSVVAENTDSTDYVGGAKYGEGNYYQRVSASGGEVEEGQCLSCFLYSVDLNPCDEVRLIGFDGSVTSMEVVRDNIGMYEPKVVSFYNKYGVKEEMTFLRKSVNRITNQSDNYTKVLGSSSQFGYSYNTTEHQVQKYNITGSEFMTLSSGFVPEGFSEVIKQLLLSEYVWVDGKPVIVVTPEQEMQKQVNKGLINYFVEFRYSNNIINNVI